MESLRKPVRGGVRAVIFDLDGVLVSSIPVHFEAFRRTFAAEGKEFRYEDYLELGAGAAREVLIRRIMGELPEAKLSELIKAKAAHVRACVAEMGLSAIPGARPFVEAVRSRGFPVGVATASRTPDLLLEGAGLRDLFEVVVDRNQVERPKPHPDLYLAAADALRSPAESCLVFEDSPAGVESARRAGMRVIALTTTEPPDRLSAADAILPGFDAVDLDEWVPRP